MKTKIITLLSVLTILSSCGSRQAEQTVLGPIAQSLIGFARPASAPASMEDIRKQITPQVRQRFRHTSLMIAQLERNDRASILVRKGENRDVETYFTPDNISVSLRDGVLIGTRGLGFDLISADVSDTIASIHRGGRAVRIHRYLDGEDQIVIKSYICDYRGNTNVTETCYGKDHTFENNYQMSAGKIIASRQWIGPYHGYIRLEDS
tara:strand:+ start:119 stop:739 length:621 start_codon:yes stop_codon:yes gene_type:complete